MKRVLDRGLVATLLAVILLLAGCGAPPKPKDDPPMEPIETPEENPNFLFIPEGQEDRLGFLVQSGCTSFETVVETSPAYAKKRLPPGLAPRMGSAGPLLSVRAWQCAASTLGGAKVDMGPIVVLSLAVEPAPEFEGSDVEAWWLPVFAIAKTPDGAGQLLDWGVPVRKGQITMQVDAAPGTSAKILRVEAEASPTRIVLAGTAASDTAQAPGSERYYVVNNSIVAGGVDLARAPTYGGRSQVGIVEIQDADPPLERPRNAQVTLQLWPATARSYTWLPFDFAPEGADDPFANEAH